MGTTTEPVYLRVLEDLRSRIRSGVLEPGARVPSRNAIITNYGVGETAAKHALAVLLAEGLIEARPGSGCYVRKAPAAGFLEHDRPQFPGSPFGVAETLAVAGQRADPLQHATRKLAWEHQTEHVQPPAPIARRLNLGPGDVATMTRYLLSEGGEPVQGAIVVARGRGRAFGSAWLACARHRADALPGRPGGGVHRDRGAGRAVQAEIPVRRGR